MYVCRLGREAERKRAGSCEIHPRLYTWVWEQNHWKVSASYYCEAGCDRNISHQILPCFKLILSEFKEEKLQCIYQKVMTDKNLFDVCTCYLTSVA